MSRTIVKNVKRLEWRRDKLREVFVFPDVVEASVEVPRSMPTASRCASPGSPSANAWSCS